MTAPKRRWFRFSLATLFMVVVAFCCWLAWQVDAVQQRSLARSQIEAAGGRFLTTQGGGWIMVRERFQSVSVSAFRRLLGDMDADTIVLPNEPDAADLDRISQFPEAEILRPIPDLLLSI